MSQVETTPRTAKQQVLADYQTAKDLLVKFQKELAETFPQYKVEVTALIEDLPLALSTTLRGKSENGLFCNTGVLKDPIGGDRYTYAETDFNTRANVRMWSIPRTRGRR
jgi:hypothetical protein